MSYCQNAVTLLREKGYKITIKRTKALQYIESVQGIFSPYDFVARYPEAKFDKVTLYRFFDLLQSLHLVQKIHSLNGYVRTDCDSHHHQHYFLICSDCHACEEKIFDNEKLNLHTMGIFPQNHCIEIVGNCEICQSNH